MRNVEVFRWNMASETKPGKRSNTTWHMTEEEALARDPTATPVPGSGDVRVVPDSAEDEFRMHTHAHHAGPVSE